jgi:hypothetical protein
VLVDFQLGKDRREGESGRYTGSCSPDNDAVRRQGKYQQNINSPFIVKILVRIVRSHTELKAMVIVDDRRQPKNNSPFLSSKEWPAFFPQKNTPDPRLSRKCSPENQLPAYPH